MIKRIYTREPDRVVRIQFNMGLTTKNMTILIFIELSLCSWNVLSL